MAYQALYRKYRPSNFDEVVGQKHIVQTLKNAVAKNRIAHAYLFCGPRGTGKTSIAKIFARTLNCTGENPPCMECENCRLSLDGSHPDIIEIDAASNNGVDEVRSLVERVGYAPMQGRYKVYIIDEVHMMTTGAFNALLKTIEEPPEHVVFIFATTEPNKVLPTILSRVQRFDFSKVSQPEITQQILKICDKENILIDQDGAEMIAAMADGGMRDALSILDQCIAYQPDGIDAQSVREIYGVVQAEDIGRIFRMLHDQKSEEAMEEIQKLYDAGMDMKRFCADLIELLKDSLILELSANSPLISAPRKKVLQENFLKDLPENRIALLKDLMDVYQKLGFASSVIDYIQTILLKYSYMKSHPTSQAVSDQNLPGQISSRLEGRKDYVSSNKDHNPVVQQSDTRKDKSDVSRETLSAFSDLKIPVRFDEEMLLGLLVGGNKEEKNSDLSHMNEISQYRTDPSWGRYAAVLDRMNLVACGSNYILAAFSKQVLANQVNEIQEREGFESFFNQLLGKPKKLFAVTNAQASELVNVFRHRAKEKTLPPAFKVEIRDLNKGAGNKEESTEELLRKVFPEITVVDD